MDHVCALHYRREGVRCDASIHALAALDMRQRAAESPRENLIGNDKTTLLYFSAVDHHRLLRPLACPNACKVILRQREGFLAVHLVFTKGPTGQT